MSPAKNVVHLDLDAIEESKEPSMVFTLGGREWHCKESDDVSWPLVEGFFMAQASGDIGGVVLHFDDLFGAVLFEDEVDAFFKLKTDTKGPMTYRRFSELAKTIVETVFGVPTEPPGTSRAGRRQNAASSGAGSSSPAKRSRRAS